MMKNTSVLHEAVRVEVERRIEAGIYEPGQALPSADALSREFSVSVITVKRALRDLQTAGLLRATAGLGTFVKERQRFLRDLDTSISSVDDAKKLGVDMSVQLVSVTRERITDGTLKNFDPPDGTLLCIRKVVLADNSPVMFDTSYLPTTVPDAVVDQFGKAFIADVMRKQGIVFTRTKMIIDAAPASLYVQQIFGVPTGYPTLRRIYEMTSSDSEFQLLGIVESTFDRLACTVELKTSKSSRAKIKSEVK